MRKKDFQLLPAKNEPEDPSHVFSLRELGRQTDVVPINSVVWFSSVKNVIRKFDFKPFYNKGYNEIVFACQHTIEHLTSESINTRQASLSINTITGYCRGGLCQFFKYCNLLCVALKKELTLSDITKSRIAEYVNYLQGLDVCTVSQKNFYSQIKAVLIALHKDGYLPHANINTLFPRNPFPNTNKIKKGERPLSTQETRQLVVALKSEMTRIQSSDTPLSSFDLTICVLAIGIATGMNPTPVLSLSIDSLQPHPLKANLRLLVAFKRRGNATKVVSMRQSEDMALLRSVKLNVANAIEMIIERNATLRSLHDDVKHLLVCACSSNRSKSSTQPLSTGNLQYLIAQFVKTHHLTDDDGKPLHLNMMRLRKTYINRIWELSGQDPLITALHGKHSSSTANQYYWEAPPEAERNMRFIGETRIKQLLDGPATAVERNAVAGCKDTKYGQFAPKNGSVCTEVLSCFRCKSFVVTDDDLYRLYSFYWAVVCERDSFGAKRWGKYLRHIIRIIDNDIGPQFDAERVLQERERAKVSPHPYWRNLDMVRFAR